MTSRYFTTHPRKLERDRIVARMLQDRAYESYLPNIALGWDSIVERINRDGSFADQH